MDTRNSRGVTYALPVSWEEIGHLMEEDRADERGKGEWAPGTLAHWMKCDSRSCYSRLHSVKETRQILHLMGRSGTFLCYSEVGHNMALQLYH
ncbi:hypothetical protein EVAR_48838_1 [Eumeta japonica]|uniref:Uncharacterized protein n=1 Tax=Eumeta variegata TaxID=151549 RepID=A0A4C1YD05_EUMVA|nr:hypothetical protein EVAR_48838_1 [Eumeta japonica]